MSEVSFVSNENNTQGVTTEVLPMKDVTDDEWRKLQQVHIESLQAQLPKDQWDRVNDILHTKDLATYRDRRVHPNTQAGEDGWRKKQIFTKPKIAISRDQNNDIIGAVLGANNTSGKGDAWRAEAGLKMIISPDFPVPVFGGRRFAHVREAYAQPDFQEELELEEGVIAVSGVTLTGLYRLLDKFNPRQQVSAYLAEGDPADGTFDHLLQAIELSRTGDTKNNLAGFTEAEREVRFERRVIDVMRTISNIPSRNSANQ
jgi:hypothetical protein